MGHLDVTGKFPIKQPREWLPVAAQVADLAEGYCDRNLVARVAPGAGHGAPACYIYALDQVEFDADRLLPGYRPESINLSDREGMLRVPTLVGAIAHEAAHARHTQWEYPKRPDGSIDLPSRVIDVMTTLEESRIEAQLLRSRTDPDDETARYIRSVAWDIIAKDFQIADSRYGTAAGAALTLARVTAGSLLDVDVIDIRKTITDELGADVLARLEEVWTEFQSIRTDPDRRENGAQVEQMIRLAYYWLDAIGVDPTSRDDDLAAKSFVMSIGGGDDGDDGDQDGDGSGHGEGEDEKDGKDGKGEGEGHGSLGKMVAEAGQNAADDAEAEARNDRVAEKSKRIVREHNEAEARRKDHEKEADKVFKSHGYSPTSTRQVYERPPTAEEHKAAVVLARALEKVSYQDRHVVETAAELPPGRLRSRQAMMREVERSRGAIMTAEPWKVKRRKHVDQVPLTIGLMLDVSGSMGPATEPMGTLGWVLPEAVNRIEGTVASVTFGAEVHSMVLPRQRQPKVRVHTALDGHEAFKTGFSALDGLIHLLDGEGARLLVIASDGQFVSSPHAKYADKMMPLLQKAGVGVLWLDFDARPGPDDEPYVNTHGYGEPVRVRGMTTAQIAVAVGQAAVRVLDRMSRIRAAG